jgi:hypothetical protein
MPHNLVPTRNAIRKTPGEISSIYGVARSAHSSMPVKGPRRQSLRSRRGRAWCASGLFDAFGYCPRRDASARVPAYVGASRVPAGIGYTSGYMKNPTTAFGNRRRFGSTGKGKPDRERGTAVLPITR